jgi:two-component system, cell cycle sensor histidine kinase and response regulator CckA
VLVDAAQIAHVLLNLGLNARDAMPDGGRLTLGSRHLSHQDLPPGPPWPAQPPHWLSLSVTDTGVGMSAETLAHLFEPFFTTKGERGNGLGLATSYALVQRNAGFLRAESELGKGASFHLYFPEHAATARAVAPSVPAPRAQHGLGVMVAEDDENVRSSIVRVLDAAGFRVFESANAPSAIRLLERVGAQVDVLCTDGIMPGGGTRELIDRYLSSRPEGKVILCSGYVKEELLRRQIDAGALAYLAKPFLPDELVARIHALLRPRASAPKA